MFGSDWRKLAKTVGIGVAGLLLVSSLILISFGAGVSSGRYEADAERHTARYATDSEQRVNACSREASPTRTTQCIEEALAASRANQRDEEDLKAQREMAKWAGWLLIITAIQVPIGALGLVALLITIDQGRKALEHARSVSRTELRPYLSSGNYKLRKKGEVWWVKAVIRNHGVLPAKNVRGRSDLLFVQLPLPQTPPPFEDSGVIFTLLTPKGGSMSRSLTLTAEQEVAIEAYEAVFYFHIWIAYRPTPDSDEEIFEDVAVLMGEDLDGRQMHIAPAWSYEDPAPDEDGQELLSLGPPSGEQSPEAPEPPAE